MYVSSKCGSCAYVYLGGYVYACVMTVQFLWRILSRNINNYIYVCVCVCVCLCVSVYICVYVCGLGGGGVILVAIGTWSFYRSWLQASRSWVQVCYSLNDISASALPLYLRRSLGCTIYEGNGAKCRTAKQRPISEGLTFSDLWLSVLRGTTKL